MRRTPVTLLLIAANVLVLLAMVTAGDGGLGGAFAGDNPVLGKYMKVNDAVQAGELYRLFTCMFLHLSLIHIALNMYVLWDLGRLAEGIWGSGRFLFLYLVAGLAGSLASFAFVANPSAGASGAVFGVAGALVAARFLARSSEVPFPKQALGSVVVLVLYNVVVGFTQRGVDNAAHLGGLVAGAALGFAFLPSRAAVVRLGLVALTLAAMAGLYLVGTGQLALPVLSR